MKTLRSIFLAVCAALLLSHARATTVIPPSFDELVAQAEIIFQGSVTDTRSEWVGEGGQRHIVTYVTFKVEDAVKGEPGAAYTMRMLGGTVGDQTMKVTDSPEFKVGDRDILFVEHNGTQFVPLVGIMHGRFRVNGDAAKGTVLTNSGEAVSDVAQLGKEDVFTGKAQGTANAAGASAMDANAFKAAIRAKLRETTR
jgi:hypothetical protein